MISYVEFIWHLCKKLIRIDIAPSNKWLYLSIVESKCFMNLLHFHFNPAIPHPTHTLHPTCICCMLPLHLSHAQGQVHASQEATSQTFLCPYNLDLEISTQNIHLYVQKTYTNVHACLIHIGCSHHKGAKIPLVHINKQSTMINNLCVVHTIHLFVPIEP